MDQWQWHDLCILGVELESQAVSGSRAHPLGDTPMCKHVQTRKLVRHPVIQVT